MGSPVCSGACWCLHTWQGARSTVGRREWWVGGNDSSVNHFRGTTHEGGSTQPALPLCQVLHTGTRAPVTHSCLLSTANTNSSAGQERVPSLSPVSHHASGERGERRQLWGPQDGTHRAALPPPAAHTHIPTAPRQGDGDPPPQASSQGVKVPCYCFCSQASLICSRNSPGARAFTSGSAVEPCHYRLQVP